LFLSKYCLIYIYIYIYIYMNVWIHHGCLHPRAARARAKLARPGGEYSLAFCHSMAEDYASEARRLRSRLLTSPPAQAVESRRGPDACGESTATADVVKRKRRQKFP
jgi:hypothetical protein